MKWQISMKSIILQCDIIQANAIKQKDKDNEKNLHNMNLLASYNFFTKENLFISSILILL